MTDARGDRDAWCQRLIAAHGSAVRRLAASVEREPARRQDLVQEIWLAVWQALARFRGECSERTFVFRIAHNRAVSHVQHWRIRHTDPLDAEAPLASTAPDPEHALDTRRRHERLQVAVGDLPMALRQVVVLTLEGLSQREVGEVVGITEGNVAVRLSRARALLTRALADGREPTR